MRAPFVLSVLTALLREGEIRTSDHVLAVCAGEAERDLFRRLGFARVLISNLDARMEAAQLAPFEWSCQDAQQLTFPDASFDTVFVADGLHHCRSPHRALTEMYRVARRMVIVVESRDNLLMRVAIRLGLSPAYELEAVVDNDFSRAGVDNTPIPNYIYRWTEAEFKKVVRSYNPCGKHGFRFFYGLNLPLEMAALKRSRGKLWTLYLVRPIVQLFTLLFKRQCNSLAMVVTKPLLPEDLWPWLVETGETVVFDRTYAARHFRR